MPKFNMTPLKNPMPAQEPDVRNKNFKEVALGYTEEMAIDEAKRCLNCKNRPCVAGCPVNIAIPEFISKVAEGDFEGAYQIISLSSSLPTASQPALMPRVHLPSHCVSCGQTRPQTAGRELVIEIIR